jgi:hypothetical protein
MPVSRLRVISHNITKYRENETREQNYLLSIIPMQVYNTPLVSRIGTRPPRGPRCPLLIFFTLMVGAPRFPAPAPPRGGPLSTFVTMMVGAPESPALTPPRGPTVDVFYVDGGRCRTHRQRHPGGPSLMSSSTTVVDAVRPVGSAPRGAAIDVFFNHGGGRCRTHR